MKHLAAYIIIGVVLWNAAWVAAITMKQYRESRPPVKPLTDPNEIIWRTDICEVNYDRKRCTA